MIKKRTMQTIQSDIDTAFELAIEKSLAEGEEWDGSLPDDLQDVFDELEIEKEDKIDGVIRAIKQAKADASFLRSEKKALDARIKSKENKAKGYIQYLDYVLGGAKYESAGGVVSYRKSSPLVLSEAVEATIANGEVPQGFEDFAEVSTVVKVPKADVKKYISAGNTVAGAEIVTKVNMQIK